VQNGVRGGSHFSTKRQVHEGGFAIGILCLPVKIPIFYFLIFYMERARGSVIRCYRQYGPMASIF
jgi:hypothetical protein